MKKFITIGLAALLGFSANAASLSITVKGNTMTNVLPFIAGNAKVLSYVWAPANSNLTSVVLYDTPTNQFTYIVAAYTNTISYGSNAIVAWTNYFGVVNSWTNFTLIDNTNNVVNAVTNNYPARMALTAVNGFQSSVNPASTVYEYGIWATNTSVNDGTLTIQYQY